MVASLTVVIAKWRTFSAANAIDAMSTFVSAKTEYWYKQRLEAKVRRGLRKLHKDVDVMIDSLGSDSRIVKTFWAGKVDWTSDVIRKMEKIREVGVSKEFLGKNSVKSIDEYIAKMQHIRACAIEFRDGITVELGERTEVGKVADLPLYVKAFATYFLLVFVAGVYVAIPLITRGDPTPISIAGLVGSLASLLVFVRIVINLDYWKSHVG